MLWSLLASVVFGIIAGFQGQWRKFSWIWVSIILLVAIVVLMAKVGANTFGEIRRTTGLPYRFKGKTFPAGPAKNSDEIEAALTKSNPVLITVIGLAVIS
jgi:hypothetical protein